MRFTANFIVLASCIPGPSLATTSEVETVSATALSSSTSIATAAATATGLAIDASKGSKLFVADYNGTVTTLSLTSRNSSYHLDILSTTRQCGANPTWLTLDATRGLLYCLDEGLTAANGSLTSFRVHKNGTLEFVQSLATIAGPVSAAIFETTSPSSSVGGSRGLAVAHYEGSAVTTFALDDRGGIAENQRFSFVLENGPGPVADRQDVPHEHQVVVDPTGQYLLVPDLGADVVRIFAIGQESLDIVEREDLRVEEGSGPRHVAFWNPSGVIGSETFLFVVAELASSLTAYEVEYMPGDQGLRFRLTDETTTFGGSLNLPAGTAPAEIQVSPDNRFLIVSNRNDSSFTVPQASGDKGSSDSLSTFSPHPDGTLKFVQLAAAGGNFPRHFSLNRYGNLAAAGLQYNQTVDMLKRDIATGLVGETVASVNVGGNVTCVVFG